MNAITGNKNSTAANRGNRSPSGRASRRNRISSRRNPISSRRRCNRHNNITSRRSSSRRRYNRRRYNRRSSITSRRKCTPRRSRYSRGHDTVRVVSIQGITAISGRPRGLQGIPSWRRHILPHTGSPCPRMEDARRLLLHATSPRARRPRTWGARAR